MDKKFNRKYEAIIGLEIHAQLNTNSKAFSPEMVNYSSEPNSNTHPISLTLPGTLPIPNKKVIEYAIMLGLACKLTIT